MAVDKFVEEGIVFDVVYKMQSGGHGISHFMLPKEYDEEQVKSCLEKEPNNINVVSVAKRMTVIKIID